MVCGTQTWVPVAGMSANAIPNSIRNAQDSLRGWQPAEEIPQLVKLSTFCKLVDISDVTGREWITSGKLRAVRCGSMIRIPVSEIARLFVPREDSDYQHTSRGATKKWAGRGKVSANAVE
jgi:excisionase family DNA binding protein